MRSRSTDEGEEQASADIPEVATSATAERLESASGTQSPRPDDATLKSALRRVKLFAQFDYEATDVRHPRSWQYRDQVAGVYRQAGLLKGSSEPVPGEPVLERSQLRTVVALYQKDVALFGEGVLWHSLAWLGPATRANQRLADELRRESLDGFEDLTLAARSYVAALRARALQTARGLTSPGTLHSERSEFLADLTGLPGFLRNQDRRESPGSGGSSKVVRVLLSYPRRLWLFEALAEGPTAGMAALEKVFGDISRGIEEFEEEMRLVPSHIWRYPPIVAAGVCGMLECDGRLSKADVATIRFAQALGRAIDAQADALAAAIALSVAALTVTNPLLLAVVSAVELGLAYDAFLKERENELASSASLFGRGMALTDRDPDYSLFYVDVAATVLSTLQLVKGAIRARPARTDTTPTVSADDMKSRPQSAGPVSRGGPADSDIEGVIPVDLSDDSARAIGDTAADAQARLLARRSDDSDSLVGSSDAPHRAPATAPQRLDRPRPGEVVAFLLDTERGRLLGKMLGRTLDSPPRQVIDDFVPKGGTASLQELEDRAAALRARIKEHWDSARPSRGSETALQAAERVFQRMRTKAPSNPNEWVRKKLFDLWRSRTMTRIVNEEALVRDLAESGITVASNPQTRTKSFRVRARSPEGKRVHVWVDIDHARIRHADAVTEALSTGNPEHLASTVESSNLQLSLARENRVVLERLRAENQKGVYVPIGDDLGSAGDDLGEDRIFFGE